MKKSTFITWGVAALLAIPAVPLLAKTVVRSNSSPTIDSIRSTTHSMHRSTVVAHHKKHRKHHRHTRTATTIKTHAKHTLASAKPVIHTALTHRTSHTLASALTVRSGSTGRSVSMSRAPSIDSLP